jgi:cAMP phosphodiesterase
MRVRLLPSALGPAEVAGCQYLTTYLINLSHSHLDHISSLPTLIDSVYDPDGEAVTFHASPATMDSVRRHLLNNEIWVDYVALGKRMPPFFRHEPLEPGRAAEIEGLRITPVPVNHVVPTLGFLIEDATSAIVITTGPTEEIWQRANRLPHLKAVFLEASFPEMLAGVAVEAKHLTAKLFAAEVRKLTGKPQILAVHLKARFLEQMRSELAAIGLPRFEVVEPGRVYDFA